MAIRSRFAKGALCLLVFSAAAAAADKPLDEGKLDPAWFAGAGEFREADEIDYLWIKEGFSLDGRKLRFVAWPEPQFLGPQAAERDTKDMRLAQEINGGLPGVFATAFRNAFGPRLSVVEEGEDVEGGPSLSAVSASGA